MKILVIHASAGAGHLKAAEALYNGFQNHTDHEVVFVDALDHTSPFRKILYQQTYYQFVSKCPWLWALFFTVSNWKFLHPLITVIRRAYNSLFAKGLHDYLIREQFDYVFSTHFMPTEVSAALKRQGKIRTQVVTVVTDFDVHRIWLGQGVDIYTCAGEDAKNRLLQSGVPEEKIRITGIPVDEKFITSKDIGQLKQSLGIQQDVFTVLIATGSFGIGPIEQIIEALKGFQILVVCGHNKELHERLKQNPHDLVKPFGYVNNMHELMAVSDVMVSKPGGLSVSESLVTQLPMIFFSAIPGQEMGNVRVLAKHGIGREGFKVKDIIHVLKEYQSSRDTFLTAVKNTKELARPNAVQDIMRLTEQY